MSLRRRDIASLPLVAGAPDVMTINGFAEFTVGAIS
jgi:hypothetical protein